MSQEYGLRLENGHVLLRFVLGDRQVTHAITFVDGECTYLNANHCVYCCVVPVDRCRVIVLTRGSCLPAVQSWFVPLLCRTDD
jgi:hypothetical protein